MTRLWKRLRYHWQLKALRKKIREMPTIQFPELVIGPAGPKIDQAEADAMRDKMIHDIIFCRCTKRTGE